MEEGFVVVSGLPASGKSTLAQRLSPALGLPVLDKDAILERLFELKGSPRELDWRRSLSRESDVLLRMEAASLRGAILVSHWHRPGKPPDSGTPTGWICELPGQVINVHCECPADVAAERFINRKRHPGHLDEERSWIEILASIQTNATFGHIEVGQRIEVDTSQPPNLDLVLSQIRKAFANLSA